MAKKPERPEQKAFKSLRESLAHLRTLFPGLSRHAASKVTVDLIALLTEIEGARASLDPIKDPGASFDPSNPDTAGRLVALALLAQEKVPLGQIARSYGSGVYAIYYVGGHPAYAPASNTETPLYVGKADPQSADARSPREQGPRLYGRLADHRKMITTVGRYADENGLPNPLRIEDFLCRRLVCATNAQLVAERHLIATFRPVWNSEVGIAFGISKHGDAAKTRGNKRSPWDVLHPGRRWAMDTAENQKSEVAILRELESHFESVPPHQQREELLEMFLAAFEQQAPITSPEVAAANDDADADGLTPEPEQS